MICLQGPDSLDAIITDEEANYMSLFFAQHTPMFKSLAQMLSEHIKKVISGRLSADLLQVPEIEPSISNYLAALAGSCFHSITKQRYLNQILVD